MGTVETVLTTATDLTSGGVDAAFLIQWIGVVILSIVLLKLVVPYMPFLNPILDMLNPTLTTLEKALPQLRNKPWFQKAHTVADVITTVRPLVKLAELDKVKDPDGTTRLKAVQDQIKLIYGVKSSWTKEQEDAVNQIVKIALANEGLIERGVKGISPASFLGVTVTEKSS